MNQNQAEFGNEECSPHEVNDWITRGGPLQIVDVREAFELAEGLLPGAVHIPLRSVPGEVPQQLDPELPLVVYCQHGVRSLQAIRYLRAQGWARAISMSGGFVEWVEADLEIANEPAGDEPEVAMSERYMSQLRLPEFGLEGQRKLLESKVLVIGAGGLGCPVATYLAAAGVGELTIVDDDEVSLSNLPRQVLFRTDEVGQLKAPLVAQKLMAINSDVRVKNVTSRLNSDNAEDLLSGMNVIVDACDNFETRFTVNDAAATLGIPVVHGAVHKFEGIVTTFHPRGGGPCLRCLHPEPPGAEECGSCAEVGVLGVLPGLIGMYQSLEVLKLLTGFGEPLIGEVMTLDTLNGDLRRFQLRPGVACHHSSL